METKWGRAHINKDRWRVYSVGKDLHVLIWEELHGPKPPGHDIHHIDNNPTNNDPSNLICITKSDHKRIHAGWIKKDGVWSAKPCGKCGDIFPLNEFRVRNERERGPRPFVYCKRCCAELEKHRVRPYKKRLNKEH